MKKTKRIIPFIITAILILGLLAGLCYVVNLIITQRNRADSVYFNNSQLNPEADCGLVYPVSRMFIESPEDALRELFKGPTEAEKEAGYDSWFSSQTEGTLKNVQVLNSTAYIDLEDIRLVVPGASSSCGSQQLLAEIETTVKQFSEVDRVIIAINGQPEVFYEWIQLGCTEENDYCDPQPFSVREDFCGQSTEGPCLSDSDCLTGGCSGEVCRSRLEEEITTICLFRECYRAKDYGLTCQCLNNQCQWTETEKNDEE